MDRSVAAAALAALAACLMAQPAHARDVQAGVAGTINLAGPGLVPVTVTDAQDLDPGSLRVGAIEAEDVRRVDADLVAHFDKQRLLETGALDADTTRLPLTAATSSGAPYQAAADVTVEVTLEVKLAPGAGNDAVTGLYPAAALEPLVRPADASALKARAQARAVPFMPDMAAWRRVTLAADVDVDVVIARLRAQPDIAYAYAAPDLAPPPQGPDTPDFTAQQGYLNLAPQGIGAVFSRTDPRARGAGIRVADLEYYWTPTHEDLQLDPVASDLGGTTYPQYTQYGANHGTAVFGELVARDNGYGVTGGVPDAGMYGISPTRRNANGSVSYVPAAALTYVAQFLSPGDVVLIEQQVAGPAGGEAYVPIEWVQSNFDAIRALTNLGIVVVEAGGNGNQNLDGTNFLGRFDRSVRDSGAIIVGAGSPTTRTALNFSAYGTRVDLQAWGQSIVTTGYGNLFGGSDVNRQYSATFSGTSGASPIVTAAVVAVQSYLKATGQGVWTSAQLADLLKRTGTPQTGTRLIGPLPDIEAALKEVEVDPPVTSASFSPQDVNGWYLNPTVTLTADDGWGGGSESTEYRVDGGEWTPYTGPFQVTAPGARTVEYRSTDRRGNVESARSTTFNVYDLDTDVEGTVGATVPATLALTLGAPASFGAFTPGIDSVYEASTTANVLSTAGDAVLSVADPSADAPGRLVNGAFSLAEPLLASAAGGAFTPLGSLLTYTGPVSNDTVTVTFRQHVAATQALRTGVYSKLLTFTLSTTNP